MQRWILFHFVLIIEIIVYDVHAYSFSELFEAGKENTMYLLKDQLYCRLTECCNDEYVPIDIKKFQEHLKEQVFGQHIVQQQLLPAIEAHYSRRSTSTKPLVISFHGPTGVGKNFVTEKLVETLYKSGYNSKYVKKYVGRVSFPLDEEVESYKVRILNDVVTAITACERSVFIFDEVDRMPAGIFDIIASLMDYHKIIDGYKYSKALFILISNTAGIQIAHSLGEFMKRGVLREDTKVEDFEADLRMAAYIAPGGLKKTRLIDSHVIDHYIPFLPLEKKHIVMCLETEFRRWGEVPDSSIIQFVIQRAIVYDRTYGIFATYGCKTLQKKVAVHVMSNKMQSKEDL